MSARVSTALLSVTRVIPADHPSFAGHFPGQPLLPGVLLLAEVMEALQAVPALSARLGPRPGIVSAKFFAPVEPGNTITITLKDAVTGLRFELHCGVVLAASGQLIADALP